MTQSITPNFWEAFYSRNSTALGIEHKSRQMDRAISMICAVRPTFMYSTPGNKRFFLIKSQKWNLDLVEEDNVITRWSLKKLPNSAILSQFLKFSLSSVFFIAEFIADFGLLSLMFYKFCKDKTKLFLLLNSQFLVYFWDCSQL